MKRSPIRTVATVFLVALLLPCLTPLFGQEVDAARKTRNIRVRKLAQNWQGQLVTLVLFNGSQVAGRLVEADFYRFSVDKSGSLIDVPIDEVRAVKLSPGIMELILAGVSGAMGAGLSLGVVTLTAPDVNSYVKLATGLIGVAVGTWLGYKTFYQEEIIELD